MTVSDLLFWILAAAICFMLLNFQFRYILTGSMKPVLEIGALAVIDPVSEPEIGDIAMYEIQGNEVIHRIIDEQGGQYIFKGDNNQIADFNPVAKEQIQGKVIFYSNLPAPLIRKARNLQE